MEFVLRGALHSAGNKYITEVVSLVNDIYSYTLRMHLISADSDVLDALDDLVSRLQTGNGLEIQRAADRRHVDEWIEDLWVSSIVAITEHQRRSGVTGHQSQHDVGPGVVYVGCVGCSGLI